MHVAFSLFFLALFILSLPFSAACCMSGIGLLEKRGAALLVHASVFLIALTAPAAILACSVECFVFGTCHGLWVLLLYAFVGVIGASLDEEV